MQQTWKFENENSKNDENVKKNQNENFDCKNENLVENLDCNEM